MCDSYRTKYTLIQLYAWPFTGKIYRFTKGDLIANENISFLENLSMCMILTVPPIHAFIKYRVLRLRIC